MIFRHKNLFIFKIYNLSRGSIPKLQKQRVIFFSFFKEKDSGFLEEKIFLTVATLIVFERTNENLLSNMAN
jgi:hypothetical protein